MSHYPTIETIKKSACIGRNPHLINSEVKKKKRDKYNSPIIEFDGYKFRSQKECNYYIGLRARQTAWQISDLQLQVSFELNDGGTHSYKYVADFVWNENGKMVVCDVKGYRTVLYKKKAALLLKLYGITIKEV